MRRDPLDIVADALDVPGTPARVGCLLAELRDALEVTPPPADAALLASANRALAAELEAAREAVRAAEATAITRPLVVVRDPSRPRRVGIVLGATPHDDADPFSPRVSVLWSIPRKDDETLGDYLRWDPWGYDHDINPASLRSVADPPAGLPPTPEEVARLLGPGPDEDAWSDAMEAAEARGREVERAAVVEWLGAESRGLMDRAHTLGPREAAGESWARAWSAAADRIARGDHAPAADGGDDVSG